MFKGFKEFTYKMIAGANVATIVVMLIVGFSDFFNPESFPALSNVGLLFPVFLVVNLGFLLFGSFSIPGMHLYHSWDLWSVLFR